MPKAAEFILEFESKQVLVLEPFGPNYAEAIQRLSEQPDLQVVECASVEEMALLGRQIGVCILLAHCRSAEEAPAFIQLLESCRKEIHERKLRIVITASKNFATLQPKFVREGANEVLQEPVTGKVLFSKIDHYLDILPSRDKYGKVIPSRPRIKVKGEERSAEPPVSWRQPVGLQSDCWLAIEGSARWIAGARRWSFSLIGPTPQYGEWSLCKDDTWEWIPSDLTNDPFIRDEGAWRFVGEKPEFKDGAWIFRGESPNLSFVSADVVKGCKAEGSSRGLSLAESSEFALKASHLIESSFMENASAEPEVSPVAAPEPSLPESAPVNDGPKPEYLNRTDSKKGFARGRKLRRSVVNPLSSILLVSEMIQSRKYDAREILVRFCEYAKRVSNASSAEIWCSTPDGWKCVQHEDLMDMALQQKLEAATYVSYVRSGNERAYLIRKEGRLLAALVIRGGAFTKGDLEGLARSVLGVVAGFSAIPKKAA